MILSESGRTWILIIGGIQLLLIFFLWNDASRQGKKFTAKTWILFFVSLVLALIYIALRLPASY